MQPEEKRSEPNQPKNEGSVNIGGGYDQHGQTVYGDQINVGGDIQGNIILKRLDPDDARNQRNHATLRHMVRSFWIDGVLKHSLYNEVLIRLNLKDRSDLVDNRPWDLILHRPDMEDEPIPAGSPIIDIFDRVGQRLLILGEPGSGKTVMLLELANALLNRAAHDPTYPTPVVFNLSSWAAERKSLDKWLIDELRTKYNIPRKVAQQWIEEDELIPFLDGLDEAQTQTQAECIKAINNFLQEHLTPLTICSRRFEYENSSILLKLQGAVTLESLTDMQIENYLERIGAKLTPVIKTSDFDQQLRSLMRSPLMLSIITLAYVGLPSSVLTIADSIETRQKYILDAYIRRMLIHRKHSLSYPVQQTVLWLRWLAKCLVENQFSIFLIEQLQPRELRTWPSLYFYVLCTRVCCGYLFGLTCSLIAGLFVWLKVSIGYHTFTPFGIVSPVIFMGSILGLISGSLATVFSLVRYERNSDTNKRKRKFKFNVIIELLILVIIITPLYSLIISRAVIMSAKWNSILEPDTFRIYSLLIIITGFLLLLECIGLVMIWTVKGKGVDLRHEIKLVESIEVSWTEFWRSYDNGRRLQRKLESYFIWVLGGLLSIGLIILVGVNYVWLSVLLVIASGVAFNRFLYNRDYYDRYTGFSIIGFILGITNMLRTKSISNKTAPNQGIWLSFKNAIKAILLGAVIFSGIIGTLNGVLRAIERLPGLNTGSTFREVFLAMLLDLASSIFVYALVGMFLFGPLFFVWFGALTVVQHLVLRGVLRIEGSVPWNFTRFLNYCVDRIFLRWVGGGYIFVHRLIMEHFASLTDEDIKRITTGLD